MTPIDRVDPLHVGIARGDDHAASRGFLSGMKTGYRWRIRLPARSCLLPERRTMPGLRRDRDAHSGQAWASRTARTCPALSRVSRSVATGQYLRPMESTARPWCDRATHPWIAYADIGIRNSRGNGSCRTATSRRPALCWRAGRFQRAKKVRADRDRDRAKVADPRRRHREREPHAESR
jgi:hypothetical protein